MGEKDMNKLSKLFSRSRDEKDGKDGDAAVIMSPADGVAIPLSGVEDEVFSQGILGEGCAVDPSGNELYAPVSGVIDSVFDTSHAISMTAECGAELLIHCGIDTVTLRGEGFLSLVKAGDSVRVGEPILRFDAELIRSRGLLPTTPVIVLNGDRFAVFPESFGEVKKGQPLMRLREKK